MADKKLNEVTKVTDMAYVPVIMSDGSIGQIAKADLASVVAGILSTNKLYPFMTKGNVSGNLNDIGNGVYGYHLGVSPATNGPSDISIGIFICFNSHDTANGGNPKFQIIASVSPSLKVYVRMKWSDQWCPWTSLI